jgi:hypothetical protein
MLMRILLLWCFWHYLALFLHTKVFEVSFNLFSKTFSWWSDGVDIQHEEVLCLFEEVVMILSSLIFHLAGSNVFVTSMQ